MPTDHAARFGPHAPDETHIAHAFAEHLVDLGEVTLNYATAEDRAAPALLGIAGQTESWRGYEAAMPRLAELFEVFAVDLRGQGRSAPGRCTPCGTPRPRARPDGWPASGSARRRRRSSWSTTRSAVAPSGAARLPPHAITSG